MTSAALCRPQAANPQPEINYISSNTTEQRELRMFTELRQISGPSSYFAL